MKSDKEDLPSVRGDEVGKITTFERLRAALINLLRGYPIYWYYGTVESYFEANLGNDAVNILEKDGILEVRYNKLENNRKEYRLTEKGVGVVTALLNQKHSEDVSNYNRKVLRATEETQRFNRITQILTIIMALLTAGLFLLGILQLIATYSQSSSYFIDIFIQNIIS